MSAFRPPAQVLSPPGVDRRCLTRFRRSRSGSYREAHKPCGPSSTPRGLSADGPRVPATNTVRSDERRRAVRGRSFPPDRLARFELTLSRQPSRRRAGGPADSAGRAAEGFRPARGAPPPATSLSRPRANLPSIRSRSRFPVCPPSRARLPSTRSRTLPSIRSRTLPSTRSRTLPSTRSRTLPSTRSRTLPSTRSRTLPSTRSRTGFRARPLEVIVKGRKGHFGLDGQQVALDSAIAVERPGRDATARAPPRRAPRRYKAE
jgi:hypothetical protein